MDAAELKVVLDTLNEVHGRELENCRCAWAECVQETAEKVCRSRGDHEYIDASTTTLRSKRCKFCGKEKV